MSTRERITIERTFMAPIDDVWDLWTTKDGIESWWGPDGFRVEVTSIDLRVGGVLVYEMIASAPEQIAAMKAANMPPRHVARITYTEITRHRRLVYRNHADFIPGVKPYDVDTVVELQPRGDAVRMVLQFDRMHDEFWTSMAAEGWNQEVGKLERLLVARYGAGAPKAT